MLEQNQVTISKSSTICRTGETWPRRQHMKYWVNDEGVPRLSGSRHPLKHTRLASGCVSYSLLPHDARSESAAIDIGNSVPRAASVEVTNAPLRPPYAADTHGLQPCNPLFFSPFPLTFPKKPYICSVKSSKRYNAADPESRLFLCPHLIEI